MAIPRGRVTSARPKLALPLCLVRASNAQGMKKGDVEVVQVEFWVWVDWKAGIEVLRKVDPNVHSGPADVLSSSRSSLVSSLGTDYPSFVVR